jgi:MFS family permease
VNLIGDILPLALGVAISPLAIIAIILMLTSKRAKSNSLLFVIGWVLGLVVVGSIGLFVAETQDLSPGTGASLTVFVIRFVLAALLLFFAYRQWQKRPKPGHEPTVPKWLLSLDSLTPIKALGFAFLFSAVKPKNLILTVAAALDIAQSTFSNVQSVMALTLFVVIASTSVAAPVVLSLVLGEKATWMLEGLKRWFVQNNATIMFVLLLVFSAILIAEGINGIL